MLVVCTMQYIYIYYRGLHGSIRRRRKYSKCVRLNQCYFAAILGKMSWFARYKDKFDELMYSKCIDIESSWFARCNMYNIFVLPWFARVSSANSGKIRGAQDQNNADLQQNWRECSWFVCTMQKKIMYHELIFSQYVLAQTLVICTMLIYMQYYRGLHGLFQRKSKRSQCARSISAVLQQRKKVTDLQ